MKYLEQSNLNIDLTKKLPKKLKKLENTKRINMTEDGYCGYYLLQCLHFFIDKQLFSVEKIQEQMKEDIINLPLSTEKKTQLQEAEEHYLEIQEIGLYCNRWKINVAVITSKFHLEIVKYSNVYFPWVFILMTQKNEHYELLINTNTIFFPYEETLKVFDLLNTDFPQFTIDCVNQIKFLNPNDFEYL